MRPVRLAAALLAATAIAGCGGNERDQVKSKVSEFIKAIDAHRWTTVCHDVLAPSLLANLAQGGITCEQAMSVAFEKVSDPRLTIGTITVHGDKASVLTLSQATGQSAALASLQLIKTGSGWRISALGSPVGS